MSPGDAYSLPRHWRWEGYLPEPSIRNIEVWLDWQAHQLDMPHWWVELTAIPNVENPKRLAQKSTPLAQSWQLDVRPSQAKSTPCPLPPNVSLGVYFSPMIHSIRTSDSNLCC